MVINRDSMVSALSKRNRQGKDAAFDFMPLVYDDLHAIAKRHLMRERPGHTLLPGDLVHEVFLRMIKQDRVEWKGKTHFLAVGAEAMRRILVDKARARNRLKRGGNWTRVVLDDVIADEDLKDVDFERLNLSLDKLTKLNPHQAAVVHLRFFTGMTVAEVAKLLGVSKRKIEGDWTRAKAWLQEELKTYGLRNRKTQ